MKRNLFLFAFFLVLFTRLNGQHVTVLSVSTLPAMLTDTQHVQAVVSTMFSSGDCILINSNYYVMNDTIHLTAYFEIGALTVICNSTDTLDLGLHSCLTNALHVEAIIAVGGADTAHHYLPLNIGCSTVGISNDGHEHAVSIYPNPLSGELFFVVNRNESMQSKVSIVTMEGEVIIDAGIFELKHVHMTKINVSMLSRGIYILRIENRDGIITRKFVKI